MLDYGIKINEIVHFCTQKNELIKLPEKANNKEDKLFSNDVNRTIDADKSVNYTLIDKDDYYTINDHIDCLHPEIGAWFEGKIVKIYRLIEKSHTFYEVKFWKSSLPETVKVTIDGIRPQSNQPIRLNDIKPGDLLLANSNLTNPGQIGYWYDFLVNSINIKRKMVQGILFIGNKVTLDNHCLTGNSLFYQTLDNLPSNQRNNQQAKLIANGSEKKSKLIVNKFYVEI